MGVIKIQVKIEFFSCTVFEVLDSHMWLVALRLDNTCVEHFCLYRKLCWTVLI